MLKLFKSLLIFCVAVQTAVAGDFFIRLTDSGLSFKKSMIADNWTNLPSLQKYSFEQGQPPEAHEILQSVHSPDFVKKWLILDFPGTDDLDFVNMLLAEGIIDSFEPVGKFRVDQASDDPLLAEQWYRRKIDISSAWNVTVGNPDIVVALIDTGIDYNHPDLDGIFWVNQLEDLNKNGTLDSSDINGIDDDGNGFVDDVIGWDFTDAPRFIDSGDYLDPDNDPMDEFMSGHGTQIAGIIAAKSNNGTGIAGLAPGLRVMNLRAGTASGYLEEDDVARAIIYAVENGARIINMSFGDIVISRFLKDVIAYAYDEDVIMTASSGNSASDELHYPSGLRETIAVGASDEKDNLAGFSNFGSSIDLVAPGVNMTSTAIGGGYSSPGGTSFSTPVVSAIAGLILSVHPEYSAGRVRNVLTSSAKDILTPGWDIFSGAGRVAAAEAVQTGNSGILNIKNPLPNSSTADDTIWITGSAVHPDVRKVILEYGFGINPASWIGIGNWPTRQVFDDTIGFVNTKSMSDTSLTIRLYMNLTTGKTIEQRVAVKIDRTPPVIQNIEQTSLYDGSVSAQLITFATDEITTSRIYLRKYNDPFFNIISESGYETRNHRFKLNQFDFNGRYEFYIEAINYSGLKTIDDNKGAFYTFENKTLITRETFNQVEWTIPAGYMLHKSTDLDHDGKKEIIISRYDEENMFGPVEVYEFENGRFEKRAQTSFRAIPRDAGDADQDGLSDILLGYGDDAFILESTSKYNFPTELVWSDTTEFWAAGYSELDGDGLIELTGRKRGDYVVLESAGDNQFIEIGVLPNITQGLNRYGVPLVVISDINGNQRKDITFGDYDGDLITYGSMGDNNFTLLATGRTRFPDATEILAANDNESSPADVFAATHTIDNLNYEHEFDARYWTMERFRYRDYDGKLVPRDTLNFYGYFSTRDYDSGISVSDFDNNPCLFVSFFPDMYIFTIEDDGLQAIWHTSRSRSNTILIDDMDGDGNDEFYFNDGNDIIGFTRAADSRPAAPYPFRTQPLDSAQIRLWWGTAAGAGNYAVYRGSRNDELTLIAYTSDSEFIDTGLEAEKFYYYAVSVIDSGYIIPEGFLCDTDSAKTSYPPRLVRADVINERQLILTFNEDVLVPGIQNYKIFTSQNNRIASSVLSLKDKKQLLVSFNGSFTDGQQDTVNVRNITDPDGVPVDDNFNFTQYVYEKRPEKPYLEQVEILDRSHLKLKFSVSMDRMQLTNRENYEIVPSGAVIGAQNTDMEGRIVDLTLDRESFIGLLGQPSYLILSNLKGENGVELDETGKINLLTEVALADNFIVYPNPVRPFHEEIIFGGVSERAEIYIYNINGKLIKYINELPDFGGIRWNLRDNAGKRVATGVYIYEFKSAGYEKPGKIVIVR